MKIKSKKSYKITAILTLVIIFVLATFFVVRALADKGYSAEGDSSQKGSSQRSNSLEDSGQQAADNATDDSRRSTPQTNDDATGTNPALDADYPIENLHYRINKTTATQFDVSLYAIINSPSQYDSYISQLREYKAEVMAYLEGRYGDTSKLIINWSPPEARDL